MNISKVFFSNQTSYFQQIFLFIYLNVLLEKFSYVWLFGESSEIIIFFHIYFVFNVALWNRRSCFLKLWRYFKLFCIKFEKKIDWWDKLFSIYADMIYFLLSIICFKSRKLWYISIKKMQLTPFFWIIMEIMH